MKAEQRIQSKTCPKCGKEYTAPPAISRVDNHTYICPDCGTREALEYLGIDDVEKEKILDTINRYTAEGGEQDETSSTK